MAKLASKALERELYVLKMINHTPHISFWDLERGGDDLYDYYGLGVVLEDLENYTYIDSSTQGFTITKKGKKALKKCS